MMVILGSVLRKFKVNVYGLLILLTFLFSNFSYSQPDYNMSLTNGVKINDNTIEFDVLVKSINTNFNLTSYQCSFLFNSAIANGGQLSFTYLDGSSQLNNLPTFAIGLNSCDGELKLTFASMPGSDHITETNTRVGRFRLVNTASFPNVDPNIRWNFGGNVSTILTGESFQNITRPINHTNNLTLSSNSNSSTVPTEYKLLQNYPNPFNPSTKISFNLPKEGHVVLTVFNLLGQQVQQLVNDQIDAGSHSFEFTSTGLSSGNYFCKLEVDNNFVEIIKMVLLK